MKIPLWFKIASLMIFGAAINAFSWPTYDPFNYTPGQEVYGQTDTNTGDFWQGIDTGANANNAVAIVNQSVTYPGLPASPGYSFILTNVNGAIGARMFATSNSLNWPGNAGGMVPGPIQVYFSLVMDVTNMTTLWNNGAPSPQYCFGYNDQGSVAPQGGNPGTMLYRFYWLATSATTYQVCLSKDGGGSDLFWATNSSGIIQLNANQNYLIVGCETITNQGVGEPGGSPPGSQSDIAQLWVNPSSGSFGAQTAPPQSAIESAGLENNLTPYTSCIIFENRSASTPVTLISQFRFGTNWSWVTGGPFIYNTNAGPVNIFSPSPISLGAVSYFNGSANTYQWCLNGTNLVNGLSISGSGATVSGANTPALVINNATSTDNGSYTVIVNNALGSYTSAASVVTVQAPVPATITSEPSPATIPLYSGGSTHFSFSATGSTPIVYYWYSNNIVVGVTTNSSTFFFSNVQATASIYCLASNQIGSSSTFTNTIQLLPQPTAPYTLAVLKDKPIGFWELNEFPDNTTGNNGALTYDYVGGNDGVYNNVIIAQPGYGPGLASEFSYPTPTDTNTAGEFGYYPTPAASTNSYVGGIPNINFTAAQDSPPFSVEAWVNAEGNGQSTPASTIVAKGWANNSNSGADEFSLQCANGNWSWYTRDQSGIAFSVSTGASLDANWHHLVGVMDMPHATLYLYVDGLPVATNTSYASTGVGTNTIGIYNSTFPVTIGSAGTTLAAATTGPDKQWFGEIADVAIYGYALSASQVSNHYWMAGLPPTIVVQPPGSVNVSYGGSVSIPVTIAGTAPLTFEWIDDATSNPIPGQTNATLVLSNITAADSYTLQVTSPYGSATAASSVTVVYAPTIVQDITPVMPTLVVGDTVTFEVDVDAAPPVAYSWQLNGLPLPANPRFTGTNSNILTINNVQLSDAGTYQLFASNSYGGPISSSVATLTVTPSLGFSGGFTWTTESPGSTPYSSQSEFDITLGGANQDAASFYNYPVYINGFYASFNYQDYSGANNTGNGVTFCIQNDPRGAAAEGENGSGLGVGATSPALPPGTSPITPSVELEFNIYAANGIGGVGIALGTNGIIADVTSTAPVILNNADVIGVALEYLSGVLTINLTDSTAGTQFTMTTNINIPATVGGSAAYVGFTGSTGGSSSYQTITDFSFESIPVLTIQPSGTQTVLSWPTDVGNFALQKTSSLTTPNWVAVTNVLVTAGNQNQVTVSPSGTAQFFRLSQ